MNREDIIRMAREAGLIKDDSTAARLLPGTDLYPELNVFASLVAEHARNRTWTQAHWTEYERSIAAAEREACAQIVDANAKQCGVAVRLILESNATAIRARSNA